MDLESFLRLVVAGLMAGSVYALLGLGFSLLYKGTGLINWAQADFFMLGAFVGWTMLVPAGLPFWASLGVAAAVLFVLGFVTYRTLVVFVCRRGGKLMDVLLATIGLSIVLQSIAMLIWGTSVKNVPPLLPGQLRVGPIVVPRQYLLTFGVTIVTVVALYLFLQRTRFGTAMRASADNRYAASVVGIPVAMVNATTWAIGAAIAGLAGVMVAPLFGAVFFMGIVAGLKGFAAAVVGGFGNPYGALAGGLFLGVAETLVAGYVSSDWKDGIAMAALIGILLVRPEGLFRAEPLGE